MKKGTLITGLILAAISLTAYGFIGKSNEKNKTEKKDKIEKKENNSFIANQFLKDKEDKVFFFITGKYKNAITKKKLLESNYISDFVEYYPESWIKEYISVETTLTFKNKETILVSKNNTLNKEQKAFFKDINISTGISFKIKYNKKSDNILPESREINFSLTVVPKTEAKYKEEYNQLLYYLEDSKFSKQYLAKKSFLEGFNVHFVINKEGEATDISIIKSTGDKSMDELLKELVKNMPKWDPAKNAKGEFVSQEFELNNVMQC